MTENTSPTGNRADALTALLTDAPKADDHDGVRGYLHAAARLGCAPILVYPASKKPADVRTPQKRRAEDKVARDAARAAGHRAPHAVKSQAGVHLATSDAAVLDAYLNRYVETFGDEVEVNVAVSLGRSDLVVVDCDTAEQVAAFLTDAEADPATVPTVRTPGMLGPDGVTFVHSDGGHFYFAVPEGVELPPGPPGAMKMGGDDGYSVMWGVGNYVLTPPSVRAEGVYAATGENVYELPGWLAETIAAHGRTYAEHARRSLDRADTAAGPVARWGAAVPWAAILEPVGWTPVGKADGCGCPMWTAPGVHGNPKSATAHEPGCARWTDSPDPPLHIWTDNPGDPWAGRIAATGKPTFSKLQAVALLHYDGKEGAAMDALGIDLTDGDEMAVDDADVLFLNEYRNAPADTAAVGDDRAEATQLPEEFWSAHPALSHIRAFAHYGVNSADAVLGAVLARLSAHLDPCVRIDTGVKRPLPPNMFVGIVGSAGTGKSSAYHASADLLAFEYGNLLDNDLIARADEVPPELPVGSGPGVAEAFMGTVPDPADPTMKTKVRRQVRHKVLFHSDEGAGLVSGILDNKRGQDIGPTLRAAWTGAVLGQANASAERTRQVRDYAVGLCVGFQLEALAALSTEEQLEYGTPQRFVYVSATDPSIPDDAPDDPGPLTVRLPHRPMRYDTELRDRARREALARARGDADEGGDNDPMNAHRPALVARCAALLVILCDPGRTEVNADDAALAEMLLDTSARLHAVAMEWRRERETAERERQLQGRIREHVATAVALDQRGDDMARLGDRILAYVDDAGGSVQWAGKSGLRRAKFNHADRALADAALARLTNEDGPLLRDGNTVRRRVG
ncbi:bifunctional DNA primase/polymerase [Mycobacterium kansasii]|uniref:bifunctional DNA primase/polymerase n=1 Tax=Mycobacterium kansasii TaxID=1768 RepID=UPI0014035FE4|nr:bifunctional DNA primase/polymerase [Mycobacterium kansasii]